MELDQQSSEAGLAISHGGTSVMSIPLYKVCVCVCSL